MGLGAARGGPKERRRALRFGAPALRAFYWMGGLSQPFRVRDIAESGAFVETAQDLYVGTVLHLVLQRDGPCDPSIEADRSFGIWAQVARADSSGMGMEFVAMDKEEERKLQGFLKIVREDLACRGI